MSVALHFAKTDPKVQATYRRLIEAAQALGPVTEEAKIRAGGAAIVIRDCRRKGARRCRA